MAAVRLTFVAGQILTAAQCNTFWMNQVVQVCDASGDYPSSPLEGQVVYDKALDSFLAYTGSAWVRVAGVSPTAVQTWTPTVTQSGSVTHTLNEARYIRQGNLVHAWFSATMTGTGTAGNNVNVSLPVTASGSHYVGGCVGAGLVYDNSAGIRYPAQIELASTTAVGFGVETTLSAGLWGTFPNLALAASDALRFQVTYQAA